MCALMSVSAALRVSCMYAGLMMTINTPVALVELQTDRICAYTRRRIVFLVTAFFDTFFPTTTEPCSVGRGVWIIVQWVKWNRLPDLKYSSNCFLDRRWLLANIHLRLYQKQSRLHKQKTKVKPWFLFTHYRAFLTVSCARPFRRRAWMIFRPLGVADRARKPWVVARFFFFGWYVRFGIYVF